MVAVDPLASLAIRSVWVTIGGKDYEIPKLPALDWLEMVLGGTIYEVIPGWLDFDAQQEVYAGMMDGTITEPELDEATHGAFTVAAGRPWWWAAQLILMCASTNKSWSTLYGKIMLAGIDPAKVSLSAFVDALYAACVEGFDSDEQRRKFDTTLDTPPPSVGIDEEAEEEAFMALLNGG